MELKERVLNAARELFFTYGLRNVRMDEIATQLGISKKTLYEVFPKKKDIVNEITKDFLKCRENEQEILAREANDPVDELIKILGSIHTIFESMNARLIYELQRYFPEAWQIFKKHKEEFVLKGIVDNLKQGIEHGLYRKEIDVAIIARMRVEQIQTAMDPTIFSPDQFNIKEIHNQLLLQYIHGISTAKGHELIKRYLKLNDEVI
ncbi:MAG: TetR/AcrR family transcriptional regulator [Cyclobacteriaceae bacterium]|nr:TetR/AcrR family transcriptional regulator [Cyclobacteriaceae bacterium]